MPTMFFHPEWDPPVVERFQFETNILTMFNDGEQRIKIRGTPRRQVVFNLLSLTQEETMKIFGLLADGQETNIDVPLWWDASILTANASIGNTTINVSTTGREFIINQKAFLWFDDGTWEAVTISSVGGSSIGCSALTKNWTQDKTWVVPCLSLVWRPEETFDLLNPEALARMELEFTSV